MNWNQDKSVKLSLVCVALFALILSAADLAVILFLRELVGHDPSVTDAGSIFISLFSWRGISLLICFLLFSIIAWIALAQLYLMLMNLRRNNVFVAENVRRMRIASWCCFGAAFLGLIAALLCIHEDLAFHLPVLFCLALAAAFMGLIVRIVKNSFEAAIRMKDELDLTI
ncbi:MAG: DUF2975 domain-containing protein [Lachnospiraceae bacterium]|nr:DUF2975 domain-containing protein [Lachnospiraceae bacterium]